LGTGIKKNFRTINEADMGAIMKWSATSIKKTSSKNANRPSEFEKNVSLVYIRLELDQCTHHIHITLSCGKMEGAAKPMITEKTLKVGKKHRRYLDQPLGKATIAESEVGRMLRQ
jgi:hypothetical protein